MTTPSLHRKRLRRSRRATGPGVNREPEFLSSGVGTPERLARADDRGEVITRDDHAFQTENREFSRAFRVIDILERWVKSSPPKITPDMHTVGSNFRNCFRVAGFGTLKAQSLHPSVDGGRLLADDLIDESKFSHKFIIAALSAVGGTNSPAGSCLWYVLGEGYSIRDWSQQIGWSGHVVDEVSGAGVLIAALGILAANPKFLLTYARI